MEILPQLLAVLGVFGLLGATLWWLRRRGMVSIRHRASRAKLLSCADALQLSPTHALSLVRMGDRAILIGTSPAGFCLIESSQWKTVGGVQSET